MIYNGLDMVQAILASLDGVDAVFLCFLIVFCLHLDHYELEDGLYNASINPFVAREQLIIRHCSIFLEEGFIIHK